MFVYLLSDNFLKYKIGGSKHPKKRLKELQTGNGEVLSLIKTYKSEKYYKYIEIILHNTYNYKKTVGEWFILEPKDIDEFEKTCLNIEENLIFLEENKI